IAGIDETKDKARLLDVLYRDYVRLMPLSEGTSPESFDQFIFWGDILLSDFDDLDKYLVDVDRLLVNLHDLKELSTDYDFLTEDQKAAIAAFCGSFFAGGQVSGTRHSFAGIWNVLLPLYHAFRHSLSSQGRAYAGMIYRSVAESLSDGKIVLPQFDEVVFIGLNALNACEKRLLDHLRREGRADFYWDFAGEMVTDPDNPAGRFLRENIKRYPPREPFECPARDPRSQQFEVIRVPSAVGQTRKAMQILRQLQQEGDMDHPEHTAVVLPDENLLFPMLGAIPEGIGKVNVTMGCALSASSGATLFQLLEHLQTDVRPKSGGWHFYHRDVTGVLEHPYFVAAADNAVTTALSARIRTENLIFISESELSALGGIYAVVFRRVGAVEDIPGYLLEVVEALQGSQTPLEREFLYHFHSCVAALREVELPLGTLEPKTWYRLLMQYIALTKIPYEGEPLSGLQVMGPLETRALDFRNVIILSVGEGTFPSRSVSASFIPYNLRLGFGLPTYEQQDAMWAYYFYRGICRAERVWLLYDSRTEGLQSGEESRFIKQLRYLYRVPMKEKVATYSLAGTVADNPLCHIAKDEAVLQKLEERFVDGPGVFSASSLNTYLNCPLRFYYEQVERIREQDEVVEDVDASLFGTIFHSVMENLYKPFEGRLVQAAELQGKVLFGNGGQRLDALVTAAFADVHIHEIVGRNLILKELVGHLVRQTVAVDRSLAEEKGGIHLIATEQKEDYRVTLPSGRRVRLFGVIDRLDSVERGVERVVDYKSGRLDNDNWKGVADLFDTTRGTKRPHIAFQLHFYALLMQRKYPKEGVRYDPCIYSLRSIFKDRPKSYSIEEAQLDEYEDMLLALIDGIFDPSQPFEPRPDDGADPEQSVCKYCN
ncbi:MAG: PD-(D/E)XK nuclease family protein, partial [Bacteroidales bacterium]|nr:PD-(D/E)XK nuclease family protein [Bacteroidales bacterium]